MKPETGRILGGQTPMINTVVGIKPSLKIWWLLLFLKSIECLFWRTKRTVRFGSEAWLSVGSDNCLTETLCVMFLVGVTYSGGALATGGQRHRWGRYHPDDSHGVWSKQNATQSPHARLLITLGTPSSQGLGVTLTALPGARTQAPGFAWERQQIPRGLNQKNNILQPVWKLLTTCCKIIKISTN